MGVKIDMIPVLFRIGSLNIYSYGLMLALAFIITGFLFRKELKRVGLPLELADQIIIVALLGGVVGAKLNSVIESIIAGEGFVYSLKSFFSGAGLVWHGGLIMAIVLAIIVIKRKRLSVMRVIDLIAPMLILGYGIGRMGCFLSGDGDYGPPSDLPWAMSFPNGTVSTDYRYGPGVRVHPTPLYEIILCLIIFAYLWRIRKKPKPVGWMFGMYLILAGVERYVTEFWRYSWENRADSMLKFMTDAQLVAIMMIIVGGVILFRIRNAPIPVEEPVVILEEKKIHGKQKRKGKRN